MSLDIPYFVFYYAILKNLVRKMEEWVFNTFLRHFTIMVFLTVFSYANFTQTSLDYIVILISPLSENFPMLLEWFILTHIIAVVCCSILFGQTYTCYIHLYATISTITSLTIYTRLVFQLYHINFVSYLLCPLRFDIIVNRQFCLQLFQCRILIINTGYSLKNHPINRQSRSCSTVLSVFYDSITRPSK